VRFYVGTKAGVGDNLAKCLPDGAHRLAIPFHSKPLSLPFPAAQMR
jgi:hypothetical protein